MHSVMAPIGSSEMSRTRQLAQVWNWLPAFRVVAEYESIHKAAAVLRVSPSALSRTVRLLEDGLGVPLFVRTPAGLSLTPAGVGILASARRAMRALDDGLAAAAPTANAGELVVAGAAGSASMFVLGRAIGTLGRASPGTRLRTVALDAAAAPAELLRGNLDVVFVEERSCDAAIVSEPLGELAFAAYAPPGTNDECPLVAAAGPAFERVPATIMLSSLSAVAEVAEASRMLAILPDGFAPAHFRRVESCDVRVCVFALTRRPLDEPRSRSADDARALLDAVRAALVAAAQRPVATRPAACAGSPPTLPAGDREPSAAIRKAPTDFVPPFKT